MGAVSLRIKKVSFRERVAKASTDLAVIEDHRDVQNLDEAPP